MFGALVATLLGVMGLTLDHYVTLANDVYEVEAWKNTYLKALLNCFSGGTVYFPDTKETFKCRDVQYVGRV